MVRPGYHLVPDQISTVSAKKSQSSTLTSLVVVALAAVGVVQLVVATIPAHRSIYSTTRFSCPPEFFSSHEAAIGGAAGVHCTPVLLLHLCRPSSCPSTALYHQWLIHS